jgi:hypothetical protein
MGWDRPLPCGTGAEMEAPIVNGPVGAGRHTAPWSGRAAGCQVPRGLCFVRCAAGGNVFTRRFALVR